MKIAIIGAGNMGGSIARGLAKGSLIADSDIIVSNPSAGKLEKLKEEFPGISTTLSNTEAATGADVVILAVKPWFVESVMRELKRMQDEPGYVSEWEEHTVNSHLSFNTNACNRLAAK